MKRACLFLMITLIGKSEATVGDASRALQTPLFSLPQMITEKPPEISLQEGANLDQATTQAFQTEGGRFIKDSLEKRPYFRINPNTDPMMIFSDQIYHKKEALLAGQAITVTLPQFNKTCECVEGKENFEVKCTENLVSGIHTAKRTLYQGTYHRGWHNEYWSYWRHDTPHETSRQVFRHFDGCNWWDHHIVQFNEFEIKEHTFNKVLGHFEDQGWRPVDQKAYDSFTPEKDEWKDRWASSCPQIASKVQQVLCIPKEKKCISQVSSQTFSDPDSPLTFSRPCFQWQVTYTCRGSLRQECAPLREKGCVQTYSRCEKAFRGECYEWRQKLSCPTDVSTVRQIHASTPGQWQDSQKLSHGPNTEMSSVLSTLALFDEMKKDTGSPNPSIFKGAVNRCTKAFAGFKDCCGKQGGWGVNLNLSGCNAEDQALAQKRAKNLCIEVGTFCAEKALGVCIRKKTSFCCFDSKMSRIFHEQGRPQLGLGFGDGQNPQCRGLSIDEVQRIDFSKIDLSEIHQEILKNLKVPNIDRMTHGLKDRLTHMTQGSPNTPFREECDEERSRKIIF